MKEELKNMRKDCGLTQSQLAVHLGRGYSKSTVSNIENGNIPVGRSLIEKWASICGFKYTESFEKL